MAPCRSERRPRSEKLTVDSRRAPRDCLRIRAGRSTTCPPDRALANDRVEGVAQREGEAKQEHAGARGAGHERVPWPSRGCNTYLNEIAGTA
jgi:hypothetical protein